MFVVRDSVAATDIHILADYDDDDDDDYYSTSSGHGAFLFFSRTDNVIDNRQQTIRAHARTPMPTCLNRCGRKHN